MTDSNSNKTVFNSVEIDRSISKIAILAILSIGSFFAFGYFLKMFLNQNDFNFLLISFLAALIFLIVFFLHSIFVKNLWINMFIVFLSCLGLLAAFYSQITNKAVLLAVFLVFVFLSAANRSAGREIKNSIKINFWRMSKAAFPKAIAAVFLFSSIAYVYAGAAEQKQDGFFISKTIFEKIMSPGAVLAKNFYPDFDLSLTLKDFIFSLAKKQAEENPQFSALPKSVKNQMIAQAVKEFEAKISDFVGASVDSKLKINEAFYNIIKNKFFGLSEDAKSYVSIGIVLLIFLTLESLALPLRWFVSFLAFIIYEILLAIGFASIELEGISKEIIILK